MSMESRFPLSNSLSQKLFIYIKFYLDLHDTRIKLGDAERAYDLQLHKTRRFMVQRWANAGFNDRLADEFIDPFSCDIIMQPTWEFINTLKEPELLDLLVAASAMREVDVNSLISHYMQLHEVLVVFIERLLNELEKNGVYGTSYTWQDKEMVQKILAKKDAIVKASKNEEFLLIPKNGKGIYYYVGKFLDKRKNLLSGCFDAYKRVLQLYCKYFYRTYERKDELGVFVDAFAIARIKVSSGSDAKTVNALWENLELPKFKYTDVMINALRSKLESTENSVAKPVIKPTVTTTVKPTATQKKTVKKTKPKPEPKPTPKAEIKPEPKPEPKPTPKIQTKSIVKPIETKPTIPQGNIDDYKVLNLGTRKVVMGVNNVSSVMVIPEGITEINFEFCYSDECVEKMQEIILPSTLKSIRGGFAGCTALRKVDISKTQITTLGDSAFRETSIEHFIAPKSLTEIQYDCFNGCANLLSAELPGVTDICYNAFANCPNLMIVAVKKDCNIDGDAFAYSPNVKIEYL